MSLLSPSTLERVRQRLRRMGSYHLVRRSFAFELTKPLISFTFDDFPKNAFTRGSPILRESGTAATYYTSLGLMGTTAPTGRIFDRDDLPALLSAGHELGCHTFAHCHAWDTPTDVFEKSLQDNSRALQNILPGAQFKTLSYPISCPKPSIKGVCARYFSACRAGGQKINVGSVDLNNLHAFFLERSRDNFAAVRDIIEANVQARGWLIFATHDIDETPTRFGCTPSFFEQTVACAVNSGAQVVPVSQALELIGVRHRQG
jgi:peptidoglycan/xylan/chitin deacetylase (PgdA/CDA1 family)